MIRVFTSEQLSAITRNPHAPVTGSFAGVGYTAKIAIPDYGKVLAQHYDQSPDLLDRPFPFLHFGLSINFEEPAELIVHDQGRHLDPCLRDLVARFGVVCLGNAHLPAPYRTAGQRNVFSNLNFHIDRGSHQDDHYSLFWRDPYDPVQRAPRSSSTLVLANAAAYLQAIAEGHGEHAFKTQYRLFEKADTDLVIGRILFELTWSAPTGVGEIAILDNTTVLHASYYARPHHKGYPISVRYLF